MLQGCLPYVEELTSWTMMILVDGYRDGMLSRTTMILGGGGCKVLGHTHGWALGERGCASADDSGCTRSQTCWAARGWARSADELRCTQAGAQARTSWAARGWARGRG